MLRGLPMPSLQVTVFSKMPIQRRFLSILLEESRQEFLRTHFSPRYYNFTTAVLFLSLSKIDAYLESEKKRQFIFLVLIMMKYVTRRSKGKRGEKDSSELV